MVSLTDYLDVIENEVRKKVGQEVSFSFDVMKTPQARDALLFKQGFAIAKPTTSSAHFAYWYLSEDGPQYLEFQWQKVDEQRGVVALYQHIRGASTYIPHSPQELTGSIAVAIRDFQGAKKFNYQLRGLPGFQAEDKKSANALSVAKPYRITEATPKKRNEVTIHYHTEPRSGTHSFRTVKETIAVDEKGLFVWGNERKGVSLADIKAKIQTINATSQHAIASQFHKRLRQMMKGKGTLQPADTQLGQGGSWRKPIIQHTRAADDTGVYFSVLTSKGKQNYVVLDSQRCQLIDSQGKPKQKLECNTLAKSLITDSTLRKAMEDLALQCNKAGNNLSKGEEKSTDEVAIKDALKARMSALGQERKQNDEQPLVRIHFTPNSSEESQGQLAITRLNNKGTIVSLRLTVTQDRAGNVTFNEKQRGLSKTFAQMQRFIHTTAEKHAEQGVAHIKSTIKQQATAWVTRKAEAAMLNKAREQLRTYQKKTDGWFPKWSRFLRWAKSKVGLNASLAKYTGVETLLSAIGEQNNTAITDKGYKEALDTLQAINNTYEGGTEKAPSYKGRLGAVLQEMSNQYLSSVEAAKKNLKMSAGFSSASVAVVASAIYRAAACSRSAQVGVRSERQQQQQQRRQNPQ